MIDAPEYDTYFVPALFEPWSRELINRAKVWKGDRVLDVACGTGIVACRIAGSGAKVTGIDVSGPRLEQARKRAAEEAVPVTFVERDAMAVRYPDASFDLVTCQQGLQFFSERLIAAREMRRVTAPGGRAVIACWCGLDRNPGYRVIDEAATRHFGGGYGAAFSFGDETALNKLLTAARFFAVEVEMVSRETIFPEPGRFIARSIESIAAERSVTDRAVIDAAIADATTAIAPLIFDEGLIMPTTSLIAVARVKT